MIAETIVEFDFSPYIGKSRALCVDYGNKRVGLALSDIGWNIASPFKVIDNHGAIRNIIKIADDNEVSVIVVGIPISLSFGNVGEQRGHVESFTKKLDEFFGGRLIVYWDERMSTVAASRVLIDADISRKKQKKHIDKVAASFILQGFLDNISAQKRA